MPDLVARGSDQKYQWRRALPAGPVTLGRSAARSDWSVPWDPLISKLHATLTWRGGRLSIRKAPEAKNAIFFFGEPREDFTIGVGETFVIGDTLFLIQEDSPTGTSDL